MTYQEFKNKYINKSVNVDGAYGAQCYDLAMAYMKEVWGMQNNLICRWSGGVRDFAEHFSEMFDTNLFQYEANRATNVPPQGAVFVFGNNKFGHTGIVESANQDTFVSLDQNWGVGVDGSGQGEKCIRLITHNYQSMLGWITPKNNNQSNNINNSDMALQQDLRNAIESIQWDETTKKTLVDAVYSRNGQPDFGYILAFSGKAVRNDLGKITSELARAKDDIARLIEKVTSIQNQSNTDLSELADLKKQISELKTINENLNKWNTIYSDEVENLKKEIVSKGTKISEVQQQLTSAVTTPEKETWDWQKFWIGLSKNGTFTAVVGVAVTSAVGFAVKYVPALEPLQYEIIAGILTFTGIAVTGQNAVNITKNI